MRLELQYKVFSVAYFKIHLHEKTRKQLGYHVRVEVSPMKVKQVGMILNTRVFFMHKTVVFSILYQICCECFVNKLSQVWRQTFSGSTQIKKITPFSSVAKVHSTLGLKNKATSCKIHENTFNISFGTGKRSMSESKSL